MIELNDIEIRYGDYVAVKDVNIDVKEGEFFTFLGPSGCGKTTILRSIAGFIKPYSGNVILEGKDITNVAPEKRQIGMVFQSYALFPTMTVFDNISYGLKIMKMPKDEIHKKVIEMANLVEIKEEHLKRNVSELSGGQQQRTSIGRALITRPSIVLADEPTGNLDTKASNEIMHLLKTSNRELNQTIIMITHNMELAKAADRTIMIEDGKIR